MLGRIAAIHPEARGIQSLAFLDHLRDILAFTALVAGAPKQDTGVVAVPKDHLLHPLQVHFPELRHIGRVFGGVGFIPGLIDDEEAVFVGQIQILVHRRIVGGTHAIEIKAFEDLHILPDGGLVHRMTQLRMLHV